MPDASESAPIFRCQRGHSYRAEQCKVGLTSGDLYCPICNSPMSAPAQKPTTERPGYADFFNDAHKQLQINDCDPDLRNFLADIYARLNVVESKREID
jgi:hypothetical protein